MTFNELKKELKEQKSVSKTIDNLTYTFYENNRKCYLNVQLGDDRNRIIESVTLGDDPKDREVMEVILKYFF